MNIETKYPSMIFKYVNNGKAFYNIGLTKRNSEGEYVNGYMTCRFKKDVELDKVTKIYIKKAFLTFYLKDKVTVPYIFISEFEMADTSIKTMKNEGVDDPYSSFGNSITVEELDESFPDLPF